MITLSNKHDDCNKSVYKNCDQCVLCIWDILHYHDISYIERDMV